MNEFVNEVMIKRVERTMKALEAHCMNPMFVKTREEALMLVKSMLSEGDKIGVGGSVTLNEVGIMQELQSGKYDFIATQEANLTNE